MAKRIEDVSIVLKSEAEVRMFNMVSRLKEDIEELYGEMEILLNRDMLLGVKKSRDEMKKGQLYGWERFKEIIDE